MRKKRGKAGKGAMAPQWLRDAAGKDLRLMVCGRGQMTAENAGKILRLSPDHIALSAQGGVEISGKALSIHSLSEKTAVIRGEIRQIRFAEENSHEGD